jgi:hypothetical protein
MTSDDLAGAIPAALRQQADITGSGELLWPYGPVAEAIRRLGEAGFAILAVEVYGRLAAARGNFYGDWPLEPGRLPGEPWSDYVRRACELAIEAIREDRAAALTDDQDLDDRRYFLAVTSELAHPNSLRPDGP